MLSMRVLSGAAIIYYTLSVWIQKIRFFLLKMPIYRGGPKYAVIVVNLGISSSNQNPCWESFLKDKAHLLSPEISSYHFFLQEIFNLSIFNHGSIKNNGGNKITTMSVDHLTTTTSTRMSRRRAAVIAPPSSESGKPYCSSQSGSCCTKAP